MGTAVMHITTAAIMGWGLASVWRSRRYLRLAPVYLGVVFIHGLWNGLAILTSLASLQVQQAGPASSVLNGAAAMILLLLVVVLLLALIGGNRRLARKADGTPVSKPIEPGFPQSSEAVQIAEIGEVSEI
jgi:hypothetical protein